jgi:hypothetical protein
MKITINHNGFHGHTSAVLNVPGKPGDKVILTPHQIRKLRVIPCGCDSCSCGESMLRALSDYGQRFDPCKLTIPASGEINIRGNYPQQ